MSCRLLTIPQTGLFPPVKTYTYNVEDVRVRNLCGESETTYAYNTNGRLSQLLVKTTDGVITKYVYGIGLIGEETSGSFKTYHIL